MRPIYTPRQHTSESVEPMRVFVFFSGGASSLRAMLDDPNHGKLYKVVGAYTDVPGAKGVELCRVRDVNYFAIDGKKLYRDMKLDPKSPGSREQYNAILTYQISPFKPDLICLSGYMRIVSDPLLDVYQNRILNVHPADLAILSGDGVHRFDVSDLYPPEVRKLTDGRGLKRKLTGQRAVMDAVMLQETSARSTVHIVDGGVDSGPIVVQSKSFPIDARADTATYSQQLQERMKTEGDGEAYKKALELIAQGRIAVDGSDLFLDGNMLPYSGVRL